MRVLLQDDHPWLGTIPGPLAFSIAEGVLWVAGGGRGESSVLRYADRGWESVRVDGHGLRAIHAISSTEAVVVGEYGYCARVEAGADPASIATKTSDCLFAVIPAGDGFLVGGDNGKLRFVEGGVVTTRSTGKGDRIAALLDDGEGRVLWAGAEGFCRAAPSGYSERLFTTDAPLTALARATDGTVGIAGDAGQFYLWRDGADGGAREVVGLGIASNLDAVVWDAEGGRFLVGGEHGLLFAVTLDGTVTSLAPLDPPRTITAIRRYRSGFVVGGWHQTNAPFRFRGVVAFEGPEGEAPATIAPPPRQILPPRRDRSIAKDVTAFLGEGDGVILTIEEAKARLPNVSWPDTGLTKVRFYDGDLRLGGTAAFLANTEDFGYAVAVRGSLVVDACLDAGAGGDGYDSVLMVGGDVWAESAVFRGGIKASFGGTFEVATVILCSHGDDGGTLWCDTIRAQVFAYSLYFPKPEATFDAFLIGSVYGDKSFPPERANEVFVSEVLDGGGFDEGELGSALVEGKKVLLD